MIVMKHISRHSHTLDDKLDALHTRRQSVQLQCLVFSRVFLLLWGKTVNVGAYSSSDWSTIPVKGGIVRRERMWI